MVFGGPDPLALQLTQAQKFNYDALLKHLKAVDKHASLCPEEKELQILEKLLSGVSDRQIIREIHTSVYTVQRVRKKHGLWGN